MSATGIGASVKRREDIRFITGKGHYVDDVNRPGQAYAYFVRSPHAHATIDKIDASAALNNTVFNWHIGDRAATDAAFAVAAHVAKLDIVNNRLIPNAMEPRAAVGEYDSGADAITLYTTSQNPHVARLVLSAFIGLAPEHKLRVIAPDVGGGFGSKIFIYAEETVCAWAAGKIDRPVKWTAERTESFLSDAHGRDHVTHAELALDAQGKIT